jgi:outer membrane lipoprotein-sorting protein
MTLHRSARRGRCAARFALTGGFAIALAAAGARAATTALEPAPPAASADDIAQRSQDVLRGHSTYVRANMTIVSPRLAAPRHIEFRLWDDLPGKRTAVHILAPAKDEGVVFLKLHPNLWNYIPRVERTIRIPPSMMLQPWMGSDFTNDDLVRESSEAGDYTHRLLGIDPEPEGAAGARAYVVEYLPREDAPVVWDRIMAWVDVATYAPVRRDYYGDHGELLRTLRYADVRMVQGRPLPHRWTMIPVDKTGHETTVELDEVRFDDPIDESLFSPNALRSAH